MLFSEVLRSHTNIFKCLSKKIKLWIVFCTHWIKMSLWFWCNDSMDNRGVLILPLHRSCFSRLVSPHDRCYTNTGNERETVGKQPNKLYSRAFNVDGLCCLQHLCFTFKHNQDEWQVARQQLNRLRKRRRLPHDSGYTSNQTVMIWGFISII